ncbi:MAG: 2-hydroxy-3-oxopropionate reductase [Desulfarculus sp.]|jgi:2-hydroxy-3-oxopropionate reductase|nr:MAG: 2-hydroxy-3-oxopropionate reductase [Desulfarculus sp.]
MAQKIGFVGLGIMGRPMAANLMKGGYQLVVCDVVQAAVEALAAQGAQKAATPQEVGAQASIVFSMLPNDNIVGKVALGEQGLIQGLVPGGVLVDMSTVSPKTARRIAEAFAARGLEMMDAPVSGGDVGAQEASLSIMAGGKPEVFARVKPMLEKMGRNINLVGGHGAGQVAKACNQIVVGLGIAAVAEALVFAQKSGVDPAKVRQALLGGFAQSRVLELHGQRMLERNFAPGGKVRLHKKDTEIAIEEAKDLGIYLPGTALLSQLWNSVAAMGGLDWDHASIVKCLEALSDTEVKPG